jgi:hypothetical protein
MSADPDALHRSVAEVENLEDEEERVAEGSRIKWKIWKIVKKNV